MRRAVAFLTPFGGASPPSPGAVAWFPLVGAGLGLVLGGVWEVAGRLWPATVAAAVVVAADLVLTGMLHLDGLADAADGLLAPVERSRRLEVMADPATGAFGVGTVAAVMLLRWASLAVAAPSVLLPAGLWCASRTAMAATVRLVPYARPGGLASAFLGAVRWAPLCGGIAVAAVLATLGAGVAGTAAVAGCVAAAAGVVALARRRVGGFTGDVLGAAGMVGETAGLLVAAARW